MKNEGMRYEERRQIMHPGDRSSQGVTRERSTGTEQEEQEHSFGRRLASTALQKKGTPLALPKDSTIRTDFCPHTHWQICPPLLKASSTHPVITTCAHNTKQTSEAKTASTNNTPTTSKQNAKAKQPLLATAAFVFRHP